MKKTQRVWLTVPLVLGLLLSACSGSAPKAADKQTPAPAPAASTPAPAPAPAKVRVLRAAQVPPRLATLPTFVATEDYLVDQGIVIKWSYFQSDGAVTQALSSGAVDIAVNTLGRVAQANEGGVPTRAFTVQWAALDWAFVGKKSIASVKDLSGKTIGISSPSSQTDVLFRGMLKNRQLDVDKDGIKLVAVGGTPARAAALMSGRIEASWLGFDATYEVVSKGDYHILDGVSVDKEFPGYVATAWEAKKDFIDQNPDVIQAITTAVIKANRWARNKNDFITRAQSSLVGFIQQQSKEQMEWTHEQLIKSGVLPMNGGLTPEGAKVTLDLEVRAGTIKAVPPIDTIIDTRFQEKALSELGNV